MAQYKVPQDVEADDKLLGPFTFRQFVYLMITGGCIALAFALFQIFPLLAVIPVPFILFFGALALPIKRDQPMETYFAAIISYYLKPNKRFWHPGQRESTIEIIAPKQVEYPRTRDLSEEEAGNRLSFLANIIDTEGYAVRGDLKNTAFQPTVAEEVSDVPDILDANASTNINQMLAKQQNDHHQELLNQMRKAIASTESVDPTSNLSGPTISPISTAQAVNPAAMPAQPQPIYSGQPAPAQPAPPATPTPPINSTLQSQFTNLANNNDFSVETISKQAARLQKQNNNLYVQH